MLAVQAGSLEVVKYLLQLAGSEQADMLLAADNAGTPAYAVMHPAVSLIATTHQLDLRGSTRAQLITN